MCVCISDYFVWFKVALRTLTSKRAWNQECVEYIRPAGTTCLDEVKDVLKMPKFDARTADVVGKGDNVSIDPCIVNSLTEYVTLIASTYRNNPFHNFDHACHVSMSVSKLMKRIVAPELTSEQYERANRKGGHDLASQLHEYSHGIVSDPMTVFAITFSALIHDADHRGVSNMQLMKEDPTLASRYRNKSIAEQNSLDIAWDLLMLDQFKEMRRFIFGTRQELLRFRQLIVNIVLATDIFDKELNELRTNRWVRAFSETHHHHNRGDNVNDLRATIVMEHIIQASDVSHTMQHWHVYQKWNRQLFQELYLAFKEGRMMGADPATFWYKGELGFFDNYIIPLAKKLKECNVFGVSSDEYLNYAVMNRAEWEERGMEIVKELVDEMSV
jgi:3'5'-cyclic nucleotide phosphodiesterase